MQQHEEYVTRLQDAECRRIRARNERLRAQVATGNTCSAANESAARARARARARERGEVGGARGGTQADARGYLCLLETTQCLEQVAEIASHAVELLHDTRYTISGFKHNERCLQAAVNVPVRKRGTNEKSDKAPEEQKAEQLKREQKQEAEADAHRVVGQCGRVGLHGVLEIAGGHECGGQVDVSVDEVGLQADRALVQAERVRQLPALLVHVAQVRVRLGQMGIRADRVPTIVRRPAHHQDAQFWK